MYTYYIFIDLWNGEMSDHEETKVESIMEKISDKIKGNNSSSLSFSSDSYSKMMSLVYQIVGRQNLWHKVLGGGKCNSYLHTSIIFIPHTYMYTYTY